MFLQKIGVIGMGVMGRNLAINIESRGYSVSIFNRSKKKTDDVVASNLGKKLIPYYNLKEFVSSLEKPRCILLMVPAGKDTDKSIDSLRPFLERGDILIDGGNTFYKDTISRTKTLLKEGVYLIGMGISGGEEGALKGPSLMPSGSKQAYEHISPILKKIAARFNGEPCVTYIGSAGSGHYVKMVHNGIEYGDMQLIAESYSVLKNGLELNNDELSSIFNKWNEGELNSYLIGITKNILIKKDKYGCYLLDFIRDEAENKGTGQWISQSALELEEPLSLITESVFARHLSLFKQQRITASKVLIGPKKKVFFGEKSSFIEKVRRALYLGKIVSYSQGFSQLKSASEKNSWNVNYANIARIFRSGCIIQAQFLQKIVDVYIVDPETSNLILAPYFKKITNDYQKALRDVVIYAIENGIPMPTFSSAIAYYDSYRSAILPANLIQAQRDYFGSHTYKRIDQEGDFHTQWLLSGE
ncbi:6-phosphogluconate dehydrogenase (decarboxylating) [secondary endosymbiont of Heteropsylla cubana]|uniref:6-phosphogluconate dehydrogenase, decarboxylating n=1 Tax=secondary endosymbiont of Heteropsylla cubana TaxID=134287 RepID=J3TYY5_9ENTR|nr:NADP-dependent phosphogluconate dehydrogenase [secondary endosymbiont of Heteropsylla cubana]AFP85650.1 6-phosphogluconate dehydrogenase (decarboxylating) [secondary endosymbiont of Heteropsylla cubana]